MKAKAHLAALRSPRVGGGGEGGTLNNGIEHKSAIEEKKLKWYNCIN